MNALGSDTQNWRLTAQRLLVEGQKADAAGALKKMPTVDVPDEDWNRIVDTNLNGTFRANQIFGRQMIKQERGSIINTGSLTSFDAATAVGFSDAWPQAISKGSAAKSTTQPSRL